jgi:uncharacterized protein
MLPILRRILLSPLLRLVWTVAFVGVLFFILRRVAPALARAPNTTLEGAFRNAVLFTFVLGASVRVLEGLRLRQVGFRPAAAIPDTLRGIGLGAALLTAVVGILALLGHYAIVGWEPLRPGTTRGGALLYTLGLFLCAAVFEEVVSRGILFRLFEQALGTWVAVALSAGLFAFGHRFNPGATTMSAIGVGQAGILLAAVYAATRSLWLPIGLHWAWNFFQGPVWGSGVSGFDTGVLAHAVISGPVLVTGGSFGVEISLPALVLGSLLSLAFLVLAERRGEILTPGWMRWLLERFRRPLPPLEPIPAPAVDAPASVPASVPAPDRPN